MICFNSSCPSYLAPFDYEFTILIDVTSLSATSVFLFIGLLKKSCFIQVSFQRILSIFEKRIHSELSMDGSENHVQYQAAPLCEDIFSTYSETCLPWIFVRIQTSLKGNRGKREYIFQKFSTDRIYSWKHFLLHLLNLLLNNLHAKYLFVLAELQNTTYGLVSFYSFHPFK